MFGSGLPFSFVELSFPLETLNHLRTHLNNLEHQFDGKTRSPEQLRLVVDFGSCEIKFVFMCFRLSEVF